MLETFDIDKAWHAESRRLGFHDTLTFVESGIALGATVVMPFRNIKELEKDRLHKSEDIRALTLLVAAYGKDVSDEVFSKLQRATDIWNGGDRALAQIHLGFLRLPKVDRIDVHRLFLVGWRMGWHCCHRQCHVYNRQCHRSG